jgi:hypothetical protein
MLKIHTIPKYAQKETALKLADELLERPRTVENTSYLTSGEINRVDEAAVDQFNEYLTEIKGSAYALTVTGPREIDVQLRDLAESKRAPTESIINVNDTVDRVFLLEDPLAIISGDISYIMLDRSAGKEKRSAYLLQTLQPHAVSSQHKHAPTKDFPDVKEATEWHIGLFGTSEEMTSEGLVEIMLYTVSMKPSGMEHMIRNPYDIPARNLIVKDPAGNGRNDRVETNNLSW